MLFCSPIMWVLLLIFVMQASGIFSGLCWRIAHNNEWGDGYFSPGSFGFIMGMWMSTCGSLHFYIPLLTMGLISRELSTGSIKLLYSSPISNAQIVLGKFFSTVMFAVILCVVLLLYVFVAGNIIEAFQWQATLVGLLGIFLYFHRTVRVEPDLLPVCGGVGYVPVVGLVISRGRLVAGV